MKSVEDTLKKNLQGIPSFGSPMKIFSSVCRVSAWAICIMIMIIPLVRYWLHIQGKFQYNHMVWGLRRRTLWRVGGTWGRSNRRSGPNPYYLLSRWASFPFTRFFVEQMGLAHILDILSSKRARPISKRFRTCTIGYRKSPSGFGYTPKNAKTDSFQKDTDAHKGQMIF